MFTYKLDLLIDTSLPAPTFFPVTFSWLLG